MSKKREELRETLIKKAETRIAKDGWSALRARDVTSDAGTSLGSLYNVFPDLDMLILSVNSRTLIRLGEKLKASVIDKSTPEDKLLALAQAYLKFALDNLSLWSSVFEHRMPPDWDVPDWHIEEHAVLIEQILPPLGALQPHLDEAALALRARTLFSAVHGVVKLSLEDRFVAVDPPELAAEITALVQNLTHGMAKP